MSRYALQDCVLSTPWLRRAYRRWATARGRRDLSRGELLTGTRHVLSAWKQSWPDPPPAGLRREFARARELALGDAVALPPVAENRWLAAFLAGNEGRAIHARFAAWPLVDRVRLRSPRPGAPPERQGDLVVLKRRDPTTGEPGVLLVTYNHGLDALAAVYDVAALAGKYILVLEPSTWGYMDLAFLRLLGRDLDVVVQAQNQTDYDFIVGLESNLVPVRLGAGDWVDPARFHPKPWSERKHDVVMVGAWDPLKRHGKIFRALGSLRRSGRLLRVALIGYDMSWTREHVARIARRFGMYEAITWLDRVPYDEVAAMLADCKLGVLASKREGANRGIYECWMADVPTLVYRHHRGVNLDQIVPAVGRLVDDEEWFSAIVEALDHPERFQPRAFAEATTGGYVATAALEAALAGVARRRGVPWTKPIVPHVYAGYVSAEDRLAMEPEYERLAACLLP